MGPNIVSNVGAIRYREDAVIPLSFDMDQRVSSDAHERSLAATGLQITDDIMPAQYSIIQSCADIVGIPSESLDAYVYSNPDSNAGCFAAGPDSINLAISASLINRLDDEELAFVIGHELGHAVFGHVGMVHVFNDSMDFTQMRAMRAREISADRIGLICCGSIEASVSAMIKISSGLDKEHLLIDVGAFISQCDKLEELSATYVDFFSTHPPMPVRARALLWFSVSNVFQGFQNFSIIEDSERGLLDVDERISVDMERFVETGINANLAFEQSRFELFFLTLFLTLDGTLTREEQEFLRIECGDQSEKIVELLRTSRPKDVSQMLLERAYSRYVKMRIYSKSEALKTLMACAAKIDISEDQIEGFLRNELRNI